MNEGSNTEYAAALRTCIIHASQPQDNQDPSQAVAIAAYTTYMITTDHVFAMSRHRSQPRLMEPPPGKQRGYWR
jgi:hypothetical protein